LSLGLVALAMAGCGSNGKGPQLVPGASPSRGKAEIVDYGCGACHTIPGIRGADAVVGPSLDDTGGKRFIAGRFPNRPDDLVHWIMHPQRLLRGSLMPELGVSRDEARDIAAYLYTLH
jgi:cytochrome c2